MTFSNKALSLTIPFSKIKKVKNIVPGKCVSLAQAKALCPDADIIINTCLFDMNNGTIISQVVADGVRYGSGDSWSHTWGIGFKENRIPTLTWDNGINAAEFIGPYSSAVFDSAINDGKNESYKRGRTALGITKDSLVVLCTGDGTTDILSTKQVC